MSLEQWQVALRRQFGREQKFRLKNVGGAPLFSEFEVTNPHTGRTYRVAIRGAALGENYCSCPDFAVNTLGTCKHIEFTLARLGRTRAAKLALAAGYHPPYSEVYLQYGAQRVVVFRPGTECPPSLRQLARAYFDDAGCLRPEAFEKFHIFLKQARSGEHEVRCYDDVLSFVARVRDQAALARDVDAAFPRGADSPAFARLLKTQLYPYQRQGALFAARTGRCLLADDMGLGKTIQAIAAAEILARVRGVERVLVVTPTSLKHQWRREIERFTGQQAAVIEGSLPKRHQLYRYDGLFKITNYDVIHRDLEPINAWRPELIILDEAQRIKNWRTRTAQAVKRLESDYAFVLTGTPLENRLEELHSIVEFVDRHRLGPMFRFLDQHQHVDQCGRVVGYRNLSQIASTLQPILLRRTREQVLPELPPRLEKRLFLPMTPQQQHCHDEFRETVARIVAKWRRTGFLSEVDQRHLLIALQCMRMVCNSTYLLDGSTDYGVKADELVALLRDLLEEPGTKVVVFSQWIRMHELVQRRLQRRGWDHVMFSGEVPGRQRRHLVQRFREDPRCRLFLSTDAGGVGLNLQHANCVVILDQPWNPAVLEQRIGRVHRLGQQQPVRVLHLIAQGTIEEGMLSLLGFKSAMFAGVLDGGSDEVFLGGSRLKRFMESVERATSAISRPMTTQEDEAAESRRVRHPRTAAVSTDETQAEAARRSLQRATPRSGTAEARERASRVAPTGLVRTGEAPIAASSAPAIDGDAWADLFSTGAALVHKLAALLGGREGVSPATESGGAPLGPTAVAHDPQTGQPYLKIPLPPPETLQQVARLLSALVEGSRPR
ncbi:MAG: DEAD/DEAH box helicase [Pirellulales bacterium]|nr:DEAD/DEAH box helicase [Pirellulales bacterium]